MTEFVRRFAQLDVSAMPWNDDSEASGLMSLCDAPVSDTRRLEPDSPSKTTRTLDKTSKIIASVVLFGVRYQYSFNDSVIVNEMEKKYSSPVLVIGHRVGRGPGANLARCRM